MARRLFLSIERIRLCLAVLACCWFGCSAVGRDATGRSCHISRGEYRELSELSETQFPQPGMIYRVSGTYFSEFEDSGLVPGSFPGQDLFEFAKVENAYCTRVEPICGPRLDQRTGRDGEGVASDVVATVRAEVVILGTTSVDRPDFGSNQCLRGTIRITRLRSVKFRN